MKTPIRKPAIAAMAALGFCVTFATAETQQNHLEGERNQSTQVQTETHERHEFGARTEQREQREVEIYEVSELEGMRVESRDGESLGSIHSLAIDLHGEHPSFVVVESGGILGIGADLRVVPIEAIEIVQSDGLMGTRQVARIAIDDEAWEQIATWQEDEIVHLCREEQAREIYQAYNIEWEERSVQFGARHEENESETENQSVEGVEFQQLQATQSGDGAGDAGAGAGATGAGTGDAGAAEGQTQQPGQPSQPMTEEPRPGVQPHQPQAEPAQPGAQPHSPPQPGVQQQQQQQPGVEGDDQEFGAQPDARDQMGTETDRPGMQEQTERPGMQQESEVRQQDQQDFGARPGIERQQETTREGVLQRQQQGQTGETQTQRRQQGTTEVREGQRQTSVTERQDQMQTTQVDRTAEQCELVLTSNLRGRSIHSAEQTELGSVDNVVFDLSNGRVEYVLITPSTGFFERTEQVYAVEPRTFTTITREELVLNVTREQLEQAESLTETTVRERTRQEATATGEGRVYRYDRDEITFGRADREAREDDAREEDAEDADRREQDRQVDDEDRPQQQQPQQQQEFDRPAADEQDDAGDRRGPPPHAQDPERRGPPPHAQDPDRDGPPPHAQAHGRDRDSDEAADETEFGQPDRDSEAREEDAADELETDVETGAGADAEARPYDTETGDAGEFGSPDRDVESDQPADQPEQDSPAVDAENDRESTDFQEQPEFGGLDRERDLDSDHEPVDHDDVNDSDDSDDDEADRDSNRQRDDDRQ